MTFLQRLEKDEGMSMWRSGRQLFQAEGTVSAKALRQDMPGMKGKSKEIACWSKGSKKNWNSS